MLVPFGDTLWDSKHSPLTLFPLTSILSGEIPSQVLFSWQCTGRCLLSCGPFLSMYRNSAGYGTPPESLYVSLRLVCLFFSLFLSFCLVRAT